MSKVLLRLQINQKKETKLTFLNIKLRFYEEDTSM